MNPVHWLQGIKEWSIDTLKLLWHDKLIVAFFIAVILDFLFTTVGLSVLGTARRWEQNPIYFSAWKNGQYLQFAISWLRNLVWVTLMVAIVWIKQFSDQIRWPSNLLVVWTLNVLIIWLTFDRLYWGAIGWSIAFVCNQYFSFNTCVSYLSTNSLIQLLNQVLPPM